MSLDIDVLHVCLYMYTYMYDLIIDIVLQEREGEGGVGGRRVTQVMPLQLHSFPVSSTILV